MNLLNIQCLKPGVHVRSTSCCSFLPMPLNVDHLQYPSENIVCIRGYCFILVPSYCLPGSFARVECGKNGTGKNGNASYTDYLQPWTRASANFAMIQIISK